MHLVKGRHGSKDPRLLVAACLLLVACAPAAPSPTVAPAKPDTKPAATAALAKPTEVAKPAAKPTEATGAKPAEAKPAASPAAKPALSKAEGPAEAKPAASPVAKPMYDEKAVADFYRGKNFRIVVGFGAGGGFDTIYRLWGRYAPKYIPGNPTVIVENMTGAGGLIAANHAFNVAPKDGTTMVSMDLFTAVLGYLAGAKGIEFDASRWQWVGNPGDYSPTVCAVRSELGFNTFSDFLKSGKELILGASGKGNIFYATPRVVQAATGAKIKVIDGYDGNPAVRRSIENKELDGACWSWSSMSTVAPHWFEGSQPPMKVILQGGKEPFPELKDVELLRSFVKEPELLRMVEVLELAVYHVYLSALAPGVPVDRVEAVRDAWLKGWADSGAQADVAKTGLKFRPVSGAETDRVIKQILATPKDQGIKIGQVFGLID
jgi:tripartite-type tricarboxylate transporter receptor subunit TctC